MTWIFNGVRIFFVHPAVLVIWLSNAKVDFVYITSQMGLLVIRFAHVRLSPNDLKRASK